LGKRLLLNNVYHSACALPPWGSRMPGVIQNGHALGRGFHRVKSAVAEDPGFYFDRRGRPA